MEKAFWLKLLSLLLWERGLKSELNGKISGAAGVAPLVGAWIEIPGIQIRTCERPVAPLVGAWIEIRFHLR